MHEIAAVVCALVFTAVWFCGVRRGRASKAVFTAMLMFWGASLMWGVDCVAEALDGESPFPATSDDFLLAGLIVASGLAAFAVLRFMEVSSARKKAD